MVIEEGCAQVQGFLFGRPAHTPGAADPSDNVPYRKLVDE
jgi:EAL domain-containing protein (putative c-di-GMP-specific phosphodiesterase class I)